MLMLLFFGYKAAAAAASDAMGDVIQTGTDLYFG
jgi:hypothetical protein